MLSRLARLFAVLCLTSLGSAAIAGPPPPYILVDADSGEILASRQADQAWHPASITKLMTAYLVFDALRSEQLTLDSAFTVSARAAAQRPVKMGFPAGTVLTVGDALKMMLVYSANDISWALAETVGGSVEGFVLKMNEMAARLGMEGTHFENPNGLPSDEQVTTARDLAILSRAIWRDFPQHRPLFGISAISTGERVFRSSNQLLDRYRGTEGLKTGFVCASGFNLAALAMRGDRTMIAVVLGAASSARRADLTARLLERGFGGLNRQLGDLDDNYEPSPAPAVDLTQEVCGGVRSAAADESDPEIASGDSALGPRVRSTEPVRVSADLPEGFIVKTAPPKKVASVPVKKVASKEASGAERKVVKASVGGGKSPAQSKQASAKPVAKTSAKSSTGVRARTRGERPVEKASTEPAKSASPVIKASLTRQASSD